MTKTPAEKAREAMDITSPYVPVMKALMQITNLGLGFENEGAIIGRTVGGKKVTYVVAQDAEVTDAIVKELDEAVTDEDKIKILVKHKVLLKFTSVAG
jgi:hypothetical protein